MWKNEAKEWDLEAEARDAGALLLEARLTNSQHQQDGQAPLPTRWIRIYNSTQAPGDAHVHRGLRSTALKNSFELEILDLQSTSSKEEVTVTDTPPSLFIQIECLERRGHGQFQVQWCGLLYQELLQVTMTTQRAGSASYKPELVHWNLPCPYVNSLIPWVS